MQATVASTSSVFILFRKLLRWQFALLLCLQSFFVWAKDPAILYAMECQGCHLSDGAGGLASIPTLSGHVASFLDVPGGREYLVRVPGVAQSSLSDRELTDVLNYVLQKFGPMDAVARNPLYSLDEVAQLRQQPLTEVSKTRAELVLLLEQRAASSPQH